MIEDELVQTMNNSMKDHIYRHFKENLYKVVCIANNTETEFVSFKAYRIEDNYYVFLLIDEEELRVLIEECEVQGIE